MRVEFRWCYDCETEQLFAQPPCEDGHGEDCLDLACTECGFAIVLRELAAAETARSTTQVA